MRLVDADTAEAHHQPVVIIEIGEGVRHLDEVANYCAALFVTCERHDFGGHPVRDLRSRKRELDRSIVETEK